MPAIIFVFSWGPVGALSPEQLERELRDADLMILAEALDLPKGEEEAVEER